MSCCRAAPLAEGLLRLPEEQFLRAQLYVDHLGVTAADPGVVTKRLRSVRQQQQQQAPTRQEARAKAAKDAVYKKDAVYNSDDKTSPTPRREPILPVNKRERDALAALDDPSEGALDAYNKVRAAHSWL